MKTTPFFSPGDPPAPPDRPEEPAPDIRHQDQGDLDDFIYDRDGKPSDL